MRAMQFARAARDFARLLAMVSKYKHKSWYVHLIVWIVWRQLFERGNTWYHSTCSIESRGARIKRLGRRLTNWRPLVEGFTAYNYVDRRTGEPREGNRKYHSSPMHQLLQKLVLQEDMWHDTSGHQRPTRIRLQTSLRTKLLKIELPDVSAGVKPLGMLASLARLVTPV